MDYLEYADWLIRAAAGMIAVISGVTILERRKDGAGKLMGWTAFAVFLGVCCDLLPRVLNAGALGHAAGRTGWLLALTAVPILLSLLWEKLYGKKLSYYAEMLLRDVSGIRALACVILPIILLAGSMQGERFDPYAGAPAYIRLIEPGVRSAALLVAVIDAARHWRGTREEIPALRSVWAWLLAAAVTEIAAETGAVLVPVLGKLELLALVCLSALLLRFVRFSGESAEPG